MLTNYPPRIKERLTFEKEKHAFGNEGLGAGILFGGFCLVENSVENAWKTCGKLLERQGGATQQVFHRTPPFSHTFSPPFSPIFGAAGVPHLPASQ